MGGIGAPELIIIFLVVLLVFGAKRIPEIARGLGKGIREFKSATKDITNELNLEDHVNRIDSPRQHAHGTTAPRSEPQAAPVENPPAPSQRQESAGAD
jgi:sec-independent protein translocase protein TatA